MCCHVNSVFSLFFDFVDVCAWVSFRSFFCVILLKFKKFCAEMLRFRFFSSVICVCVWHELGLIFSHTHLVSSSTVQVFISFYGITIWYMGQFTSTSLLFVWCIFSLLCHTHSLTSPCYGKSKKKLFECEMMNFFFLFRFIYVLFESAWRESDSQEVRTFQFN